MPACHIALLPCACVQNPHGEVALSEHPQHHNWAFGTSFHVQLGQETKEYYHCMPLQRKHTETSGAAALNPSTSACTSPLGSHGSTCSP
eukprot:1474764-Amphidinium_carterae.1